MPQELPLVLLRVTLMSLHHCLTGITNVLLALVSLHLASAAAETASSSQASGKRGVVVAGGQAAVDAGLAILKDGGNAADAAVATILALSVTDSSLFCFGGEVPFLIYDAKRNVTEVVCGQAARGSLVIAVHDALPTLVQSVLTKQPGR
jgi:Gamma-glutamyltranspeptidase